MLACSFISNSIRHLFNASFSFVKTLSSLSKTCPQQWCIVNDFFLFLDRYAIDSIEWHKNNVLIKNFDTPGKFWWITGSRRYDKNYSPDKGIHKMYIQKPTKPSLSIHCATLFQRPLIILCNFGGWMLYQHNFLTELRLEI